MQVKTSERSLKCSESASCSDGQCWVGPRMLGGANFPDNNMQVTWVMATGTPTCHYCFHLYSYLSFVVNSFYHQNVTGFFFFSLKSFTALVDMVRPSGMEWIDDAETHIYHKERNLDQTIPFGLSVPLTLSVGKV